MFTAGIDQGKNPSPQPGSRFGARSLISLPSPQISYVILGRIEREVLPRLVKCFLDLVWEGNMQSNGDPSKVCGLGGLERHGDPPDVWLCDFEPQAFEFCGRR